MRASNGAGRQLALLTPDQTAFWFASLAVFGQQATVDGATDPGTNNPTLLGLGPAFNGSSCAVRVCTFPTIGGASNLDQSASGARHCQGCAECRATFHHLERSGARGPLRRSRWRRIAGRSGAPTFQYPGKDRRTRSPAPAAARFLDATVKVLATRAASHSNAYLRRRVRREHTRRHAAQQLREQRVAAAVATGHCGTLQYQRQ